RERYADRFKGNYNEGITSLTIVNEKALKDTLAYKVWNDGRTIELFKTPTFSSGRAIFTAIDSAGNIATDSIQIEFTTRFPQNISGAQIKAINNQSGGATFYTGQTVTIELQTPVTIKGASPVSIQLDSLN